MKEKKIILAHLLDNNSPISISEFLLYMLFWLALW